MEDFIQTRASRQLKKPVEEFVSVTYIAPKKKASKSSNDISEQDNVNIRTDNGDKLSNKKVNSQLDRKKQQELEMKRARYDVIKFGISGFKSAKAKEAKVELAIKLGAKPPKNPNLNYKVLKEKRKKEAARHKKKEPISGLNKSLIKHKSRNKLKKNSGILGMYGKVHKDALVKNKK
ncbi:PREDICTED: uncharacterized protein C1orf131 homolog [Polistes dominula]|uniref:Uncharacterized protein C1orf131 homolog n=1 Tax=Polistes dominula TaxID=743375 RepID=A0ABM1IMA8_POLDO|nr:PREDICTED: uncharacterized protein C1orf131 homolog [Polistes dominula]